MKVKMFPNQGDAPKLENEINKWLLDNSNIEIAHVKQSYAYDNISFFSALISIWYTDNNE